MSESQPRMDGDVTLTATEGGDSRNFARGERVFARALANVDSEVQQIGGFGCIIDFDHETNMIFIEFRAPRHDDTDKRRWMTAHSVETVNETEFPTYSVETGREQYR